MRFNSYPKTQDELSDCLCKWNATNKKLRFGQWMYNNYVKDGKPWPKLFYCEDTQKAYEICSTEIGPV